MTGNVVVAVVFNIIGMILAAVGLVTPALAITVMVLSIFAILLNTLRIRTLDLQLEDSVDATSLAEIEFLVPSWCAKAAPGRSTRRSRRSRAFAR
jgi:hypothetical protein